MEESLIVALISRPGAGKGTQAAFIQSLYPTGVLSSSEYLKKNCPEFTQIINEGKLVPDYVVNKNIFHPVTKLVVQGGIGIVDGYPRSFNQLQFIEGITRAHAATLVCVYYDVPEEVAYERIKERAKKQANDEGRPDDSDEVAKKRMQEYRDTTEIAVQWLRSPENNYIHFLDIDATTNPNGVLNSFMRKFAPFAASLVIK